MPCANERDEFWPEVMRHKDSNEEILVDLANSPKAVLSEVLELLGVVAILIVVVSLVVPGT